MEKNEFEFYKGFCDFASKPKTESNIKSFYESNSNFLDVSFGTFKSVVSETSNFCNPHNQERKSEFPK